MGHNALPTYTFWRNVNLDIGTTAAVNIGGPYSLIDNIRVIPDGFVSRTQIAAGICYLDTTYSTIKNSYFYWEADNYHVRGRNVIMENNTFVRNCTLQNLSVQQNWTYWIKNFRGLEIGFIENYAYINNNFTTINSNFTISKQFSEILDENSFDDSHFSQ